MTRRTNPDDYIGKAYGKLTINEIVFKEYNGKNRSIAVCKCSCGNSHEVILTYLKNGDSKSCGCLKLEKTAKLRKSHGMSGTRFYGIWKGIVNRCTHDIPAHKNYIGRGITISDEWRVFEKFKEDMYSDYLEHVKLHGDKNTSLDRIDVNGNYEFKNCRWSTRKIQGENTRRTKYNWKGKMRGITEISKMENMKVPTIQYRIEKMGMSIEEAVKTPLQKN